MRQDTTERATRINADLDKHFPSNNGAWRVYDDDPGSGFITLQRNRKGSRISPRLVAVRIFRIEPSVNFICLDAFISTVYTRDTLRRAGYKI